MGRLTTQEGPLSLLFFFGGGSLRNSFLVGEWSFALLPRSSINQR